jgi:hypothetical protein
VPQLSASLKQMLAGTALLPAQVDSAGIGKRETDLRLTPGGSAPRSKASKRRWADDLTWADVPWFRKLTKMPLVLKGVQSGADALLAYKHGLDGIVVSNHGGRNMDTARPSLEVLVEVMAALRKENYQKDKFQVRLCAAASVLAAKSKTAARSCGY